MKRTFRVLVLATVVAGVGCKADQGEKCRAISDCARGLTCFESVCLTPTQAEKKCNRRPECRKAGPCKVEDGVCVPPADTGSAAEVSPPASGVTSADVCEKLEKAGVAKNCHKGKPWGLGAASIDTVLFELASTPNETGQVLRFKDDADFLTAEKSFAEHAGMAGPYRYGSKANRIFVQVSARAPESDGEKTKKVVQGL